PLTVLSLGGACFWPPWRIWESRPTLKEKLMKSVALLFNTDQLGGAERSLVLQVEEALRGQDVRLECWVPALGCREEEGLKGFLGKSKVKMLVRDWPMPRAWYSLSRTTGFWDFLRGLALGFL